MGTFSESDRVRIIRVKATGRDGKAVTRYIVTTLLDAQRYPAEEVASLYVHRWEIELRFRDIKTTMKMEMLRTKSPQMIRKELMMHMIVYNALRLLMLKSAGSEGPITVDSASRRNAGAGQYEQQLPNAGTKREFYAENARSSCAESRSGSFGPAGTQRASQREAPTKMFPLAPGAQTPAS